MIRRGSGRPGHGLSPGRPGRGLPVAPFLVALALGSVSSRGVAAQAPATVEDTDWRPAVERPRFAPGTGPRVLLDAAHHNPDNLVGFYGPFGDLLRADGYRVAVLREPLVPSVLEGARILVVSNALPAATHEEADTLGSAFTSGELDALLRWLDAGGALLLFVDHRPYPRAATELGRRLGLDFTDGYALDYEVWDPVVFRRSDGTLAEHPIVTGRLGEDDGGHEDGEGGEGGGGAPPVDSVATFFGHAMRTSDSRWRPLLVFGPGIESMHPDGLWEIGDGTPRVDVEGWLQGVAGRVGRGRVVVLGEAGMAVAQRVGPRSSPRGMNAPVAAGNARFLLNVLRWLSAGGE